MQRWLKITTFTTAVLTTSVVISQVEKQVTQSQRITQFENPTAKVWKTVVLPNQPLAMHHHDHPRILVALTAGALNFVSSTGAVESLTLEAGKAYWLPAMPPNTLHSDVNPGTKPIEVMVVELQKEN